MALITAPTNIGFSSITLSAVQAIVSSESPFTYKQQVIRHTGDRWEASVSIPSVNRELAEPWVAFLLRCKGPTNTFLLGDPSGVAQQGTAGNMRVTGAKGADSVTLNSTMTGTTKAGDYFQLGTGVNSQLYKVLNDGSASDEVDIFPRLRQAQSNTLIDLTSLQGHFRLKQAVSSWDINNAGFFGINFECVEVI